MNGSIDRGSTVIIRTTFRKIAGLTHYAKAEAEHTTSFVCPASALTLCEGMNAFLAASPIALTAKLVKDRLVFAEGGHAPMSHGHHDSEIQDGAEHQHERDGECEDQDGEQYQ